MAERKQLRHYQRLGCREGAEERARTEGDRSSILRQYGVTALPRIQKAGRKGFNKGLIGLRK